MTPFLSVLCGLTRRLPPGLRGRSRISRWALEQVRRAWAGAPAPIVVRLRSGLKMEVDRHDFLGAHVFVYGEYEPATAQVFSSVLRPGDGVLDIGANIGYFTLLASRLVGPAGSVHAFEPAPSIVNRLETNVRLNALTNVEIHRLAVSGTAGEVRLHVASSDHQGLSSLRDLGQHDDVIRVPAQPVDALLPRLPRVALAKLDIEGAEYLALQGMTGLLKRDRPVLIVEVADAFLRAVAGNAEVVAGFLRERSYSLFRIRLDRVTPLADLPPDKFYLLAAPSEAPLPPALNVIPA